MQQAQPDLVSLAEQIVAWYGPREETLALWEQDGSEQCMYRFQKKDWWPADDANIPDATTQLRRALLRASYYELHSRITALPAFKTHLGFSRPLTTNVGLCIDHIYTSSVGGIVHDNSPPAWLAIEFVQAAVVRPAEALGIPVDAALEKLYCIYQYDSRALGGRWSYSPGFMAHQTVNDCFARAYGSNPAHGRFKTIFRALSGDLNMLTEDFHIAASILHLTLHYVLKPILDSMQETVDDAELWQVKDLYYKCTGTWRQVFNSCCGRPKPSRNFTGSVVVWSRDYFRGLPREELTTNPTFPSFWRAIVELFHTMGG